MLVSVISSSVGSSSNGRRRYGSGNSFLIVPNTGILDKDSNCLGSSQRALS